MKIQFLFYLICAAAFAGCQSPTQNPEPAADPDSFANVNSKGITFDSTQKFDIGLIQTILLSSKWSVSTQTL